MKNPVKSIGLRRIGADRFCAYPSLLSTHTQKCSAVYEDIWRSGLVLAVLLFKILTMRIFLLLLCASLSLSACSSSDAEHHPNLTPMPGDLALNDLKDEKLVSAVQGFVAKRGAPPNSDYDFVRTDLNGDGKREGIVLFKLPHTYWCGWDGCGMAVFRADEDHFTPVSAMSGIRGPIHVGNTGKNGWRDIIVRISGARIPDKNVVLEFDGASYPNSPMLAQTLHRPVSSLEAERFFR